MSNDALADAQAHLRRNQGGRGADGGRGRPKLPPPAIQMPRVRGPLHDGLQPLRGLLLRRVLQHGVLGRALADALRRVHGGEGGEGGAEHGEGGRGAEGAG